MRRTDGARGDLKDEPEQALPLGLALEEATGTAGTEISVSAVSDILPSRPDGLPL